MSNRSKNILLIIGFVLTLILCYTLAISKTIEQKQTYNTLKTQEELFKNAPKQLSLLSQKQRYYDSLLTKYQLNGSSIQNNLLSQITAFSEDHQLKVISYLEPHILVKNELTMRTYEFVIEGEYNSINQLIYQLEQHSKFGDIISLHFERKKNFRTGRYYLQARVLLQSFG